MKNKYQEWDNFIYQLMICIASAQSKYDYFLLNDLDAKEPYDLLFTRLSILSGDLTKSHVYCEPYPNPFKFIPFKFKERKLKICPHETTKKFINKTVHVCGKDERAELIETVAKDCNINPEDIQTIYKEYYTR